MHHWALLAFDLEVCYTPRSTKMMLPVLQPSRGTSSIKSVTPTKIINEDTAHVQARHLLFAVSDDGGPSAKEFGPATLRER